MKQTATDFFTPLENTRPFLKMAFEGFAGSGKTYTAMQVAIGLHQQIKSQKPIVVYDTERALKALKPVFDQAEIQVLTRESRSLTDLETTMSLCEQGTSEILVIDSISHVWEAFVEAYKHNKRRSFIQFQDWGILKPEWKRRFSDRLVLSSLHIIFTGRAGYEYENVVNETTNKRELIKSGIKMKVENETEYEPDIVVLMEKEKVLDGDSMHIVRHAIITKDRTTVIDGRRFTLPTFQDFSPAVKILLDGMATTAPIIENVDTFQDTEGEYYQKKTARDIALEEIQGLMVQVLPGQSAQEKRLKVSVLEKLFNTRSWTAVEKLPLHILQDTMPLMERWRTDAAEYLKTCAEEGIKFDHEQVLSYISAHPEPEEPEVTEEKKELPF